MRPIVSDEVAWSVGRSVCHDRETGSLQKRLDRSRCRLGRGLGWAQLRASAIILRGDQIRTSENGNFEGEKGRPRTCPDISGSGGRYSLLSWGVLDRGAHWCKLANTTEPSVCGGDAALSQITLTLSVMQIRTSTRRRSFVVH